MSDPNRKGNPWRAVWYAGTMGMSLVVFIALGYFAGSFLSKYMDGQKMWLPVGVLTGLAIGLFNIVLMIKRFMEEEND